MEFERSVNCYENDLLSFKRMVTSLLVLLIQNPDSEHDFVLRPGILFIDCNYGNSFV